MRYRALADCFFDGSYYQQGQEFEGRELEGYDKETAKHLEFLDKPAKKGGKPKPEGEGEEL